MPFEGTCFNTIPLYHNAYLVSAVVIRSVMTIPDIHTLGLFARESWARVGYDEMRCMGGSEVWFGWCVGMWWVWGGRMGWLGCVVKG